MADHAGPPCLVSIIYCPECPPPLVLDPSPDYELLLEPARNARASALATAAVAQAEADAKELTSGDETVVVETSATALAAPLTAPLNVPPGGSVDDIAANLRVRGVPEAIISAVLATIAKPVATATLDQSAASPVTITPTFDAHLAAVRAMLGSASLEIPGAGLAHGIGTGAHQAQTFAAPVMDDLRPFLRPEPFYDKYGGSSFQLGTIGSPNALPTKKPLICRLCLKPVRTLSLKHIANLAKCGLSQAQSATMITQSVTNMGMSGGMQASGGAAVPQIPIMNTPVPIATPAAMTGGAPAVPQATPAPMMATMPQAGVGGGIPCRIGSGDGSAMMAELMGGQQIPAMPK